MDSFLEKKILSGLRSCLPPCEHMRVICIVDMLQRQARVKPLGLSSTALWEPAEPGRWQ